MKSGNIKLVMAASLAAASVCATSVHAASIVTPAGLNPGDHFYVVVLTATGTTSTSRTVSDYDNFVATDAAAGGLDTYDAQSVTWQALGSFYNPNGDIAARSRFDPDAPIYLLDGNKVADNGDGLWSGTILHAINVDTQGNTGVATDVWTGTSASGDTAFESGSSKGLGSSSGVYFGNSSETNSRWVAIGKAGNGSVDIHPMYAFSSELTVPGSVAAVPLPSTARLGLAGMAMLALYSAARRFLKPQAQ